VIFGGSDLILWGRLVFFVRGSDFDVDLIFMERGVEMDILIWENNLTIFRGCMYACSQTYLGGGDNPAFRVKHKTYEAKKKYLCF
jgi:hypothetical protein